MKIFVFLIIAISGVFAQASGEAYPYIGPFVTCSLVTKQAYFPAKIDISLYGNDIFDLQESNTILVRYGFSEMPGYDFINNFTRSGNVYQGQMTNISYLIEASLERLADDQYTLTLKDRKETVVFEGACQLPTPH